LTPKATLNGAPTSNGIVGQQQDVARIDARSCMALLACGRSHFYELVRSGDFPPPVIKRPRFVRWSLSQVRSYLNASTTVV
jgi:predicted DNA-binding transcriptional regulator AlpA